MPRLSTTLSSGAASSASPPTTTGRRRRGGRGRPKRFGEIRFTLLPRRCSCAWWARLSPVARRALLLAGGVALGALVALVVVLAISDANSSPDIACDVALRRMSISRRANLANLTSAVCQTGTLPGEILAAFPALIRVNLSNTKLSGTLPAELSLLTALEELRCGSPQSASLLLSGRLPEDIYALPNLTSMAFQDTRLSGTISRGAGRMTALTVLDGHGRLTSGTVPAELGKLTGLSHLRLSGSNKISGTLPPAIFSHLTGLQLARPISLSMSGTIPSTIGYLTGAKYVELGRAERLSGTIPKEVGRLTALTELHIHGQKISGTIPSEVYGLTALTVLSFENSHRLSGTLAGEIARLTALTKLDVAFLTKISGRLPPEISALRNLTKAETHGSGVTWDCYKPEYRDIAVFCPFDDQDWFHFGVLMPVGILVLVVVVATRRLRQSCCRCFFYSSKRSIVVHVPELGIRYAFPAFTRIDSVNLVTIKKLGEGQFGAVFNATWILEAESHRAGTSGRSTRNNQATSSAGLVKLVAVKKMRRDRMTATQHASVLRECKIQLDQKHPYILECLAWTSPPDSSDFWTLLELAEHGSLESHLRRLSGIGERVPSGDIIMWSLQIASAITYLHKKDILHRDIASRNVCLVTQQRATGDPIVVSKLADFGLAQEATRCYGHEVHVDTAEERGLAESMFDETVGTVGSAASTPPDADPAADSATSTPILLHEDLLKDDSGAQTNIMVPIAWCAPERLRPLPSSLVVFRRTAAESQEGNGIKSPSGRSTSRSRSSKLNCLALRSTDASDVWSFAVLLWEIVTTGAVPFEDLDDIPSFVKAGGRLKVPGSTQIHVPGLEKIIQQCWAASPPARPSMAAVLKLICGSAFATVDAWGPEQLVPWLELLEVTNDQGLHDYADSIESLLANLKQHDEETFDKELIVECCNDDKVIGKRLFRELLAAERMIEGVQQFRTDSPLNDNDQAETSRAEQSPSVVAPSGSPVDVQEGIELTVQNNSGAAASNAAAQTPSESSKQTDSLLSARTWMVNPVVESELRSKQRQDKSQAAITPQVAYESANTLSEETMASTAAGAGPGPPAGNSEEGHEGNSRKAGLGTSPGLKVVNRAPEAVSARVAKRTLTQLRVAFLLSTTIGLAASVVSVTLTILGVKDELTVDEPFFIGSTPTAAWTRFTTWLTMYLVFTACMLDISIVLGIRTEVRFRQWAHLHGLTGQTRKLGTGLLTLLANGCVAGALAILHHLTDALGIVEDNYIIAMGVMMVIGMFLFVGVVVSSIRGSFAAFRHFQTITLELEQLQFKVILPAASQYQASAVEKGPRLGGGQFGDVFRGILRQHETMSSNPVAFIANPNAIHHMANTTVVAVAIKTVRGARVSPEEQRDVVEECSLHMRLIHPNIVRCFGWCIPGSAAENAATTRSNRSHSGSRRRLLASSNHHGMDAFWILLEFMDGGSLDEFLLQKAAAAADGSAPSLLVPETWRLLWSIQIGAALAYMHAHGLVHRDVAARNVVLKLDTSGDGSSYASSKVPTAKLTDFGLSRSGGNKPSCVNGSRHKASGGKQSNAPSYYLSFDANGELRLPIPIRSTAPECLRKTPRQQQQNVQAKTLPRTAPLYSTSKRMVPDPQQQSESKQQSEFNDGGVIRATPGNDVWAFGVLLWEIETNGATPFAGIAKVVKHVVGGGRLEVPIAAEPALAEAMKASWQDAADRPTMQQVLVDHLIKSPLVSSTTWDKAQTRKWLERHGVPAGNALFNDLDTGSDLHMLIDEDGDEDQDERKSSQAETQASARLRAAGSSAVMEVSRTVAGYCEGVPNGEALSQRLTQEIYGLLALQQAAAAVVKQMGSSSGHPAYFTPGTSSGRRS